MKNFVATRDSVADLMAEDLGLVPPPQMVDLRALDYERAAEILRERGMAKGIGEDENGNVCAGGALLRAAVERVGIAEGVRRSVDGPKIAEDMELPEPVVQLWNDAPGRTQDEVIERLEFAAKKLRNEGR